MTGHVAEKAAFLAALPPEDPERRQAEAHAASCEACARALAKGRTLVALLDRAPGPPYPTAAAMARASAAIRRESARERLATGQPLLVAVAAMLAWVLSLAIAKKVAHDPTSVAISAGWAVVAASIAVWAGLWPRSRWASAAAITASLLLVVAATGDETGLHVLVGIKCAVVEVIAACLPFGVAVGLARRSAVSIEPWGASAMAAAGALAGHAALHLSCPFPHAGEHLLVFHFGGVLMACLLAGKGASALKARAAA